MESLIFALIAVIIVICVDAEIRYRRKNNSANNPLKTNNSEATKTLQKPNLNDAYKNSKRSNPASYHRTVEINNTPSSGVKTQKRQSSYPESNHYSFTESEQNVYKKKRVDGDYDDLDNWTDNENRVSRFEHRAEVIFDALVDDEFNSRFDFNGLKWFCKLRTVNKKKCLMFYTSVAGLYHHDFMDVYTLEKGQELLLQREPNNSHDRNAIKVINPKSGKQLGYVWSHLAVFLAPVMDKGVKLSCIVEDIKYGIIGKNSNTNSYVEGHVPHIIIRKK